MKEKKKIHHQKMLFQIRPVYYFVFSINFFSILLEERTFTTLKDVSFSFDTLTDGSNKPSSGNIPSISSK